MRCFGRYFRVISEPFSGQRFSGSLLHSSSPEFQCQHQQPPKLPSGDQQRLWPEPAPLTRACESSVRACESRMRASESNVTASESSVTASESSVRASESGVRAFLSHFQETCSHSIHLMRNLSAPWCKIARCFQVALLRIFPSEYDDHHNFIWWWSS